MMIETHPTARWAAQRGANLAERLTSLRLRLHALPASAAGRPLRFALTGGVAAVYQLALLALLTRLGWPDEPADVVAFILATQLNFVLSSRVTWRDRVAATDGKTSPWRRWLAYQASTASMAVINLLIYTIARHGMPDLAAAALGIAAGALGNFILGDRLVFRHQRVRRRRAVFAPRGSGGEAAA
jgi:putative flippase GtrA